MLNGRTDAVNLKTDSPMGSPLIIGKPRESKNISEMHKNVLMKNMKDHPGFNQLFSNKKEEPIEEKKTEKPIVENKISSATNSPGYNASPLGKKPKGSIDPKKVGSPLGIMKEDTNNVKNSLRKLE